MKGNQCTVTWINHSFVSVESVFCKALFYCFVIEESNLKIIETENNLRNDSGTRELLSISCKLQ